MDATTFIPKLASPSDRLASHRLSPHRKLRRKLSADTDADDGPEDVYHSEILLAATLIWTGGKLVRW